jgi:hypothetical protein
MTFSKPAYLIRSGAAARHVADQMNDHIAAGDFIIKRFQKVAEALRQVLLHDDLDAGLSEGLGEMVPIGEERSKTFWVLLVEFVGDAREEQENGFLLAHDSSALPRPADTFRQALFLPVKLTTQIRRCWHEPYAAREALDRQALMWVLCGETNGCT